MSLKAARLILMLIWIGGSALPIIIVILQTFYQAYGKGEHADEGLLWILPAVLPQIATVLVPSIIERKTRKTPPMVRQFVFWALLLVSLLYLAIIYFAMYLGIFEYRNENWDHLFHASAWPLIVLQLAFFAAYAGLFNEQ